MTRSLLLLRHAKAATDSETGTDFDRPLSKRGRRAADAIARFLQTEGLKPDLVFCSMAQRTRETLEPILDIWPELNVRYEEDLYLASIGTGFEYLKTSGDAQTTLIIAHNPMTEVMLHRLIDLHGDNDMAGLADASMKYPTGGLSILSLDIDEWTDLKSSCGVLKRFVKPRALSGESG